MTREEAIDMIKHILESMPKEPPTECDNVEEWLYEDGEIRKALDMAIEALKQLREQTRWIPMIRREPTQEEKDDYFAKNGEELCYMVENEMPENGQEVLVSSGGYVSEDVFDEDYYSFENHETIDVDAWMPLPKPYKAEM